MITRENYQILENLIQGRTESVEVTFFHARHSAAATIESVQISGPLAVHFEKIDWLGIPQIALFFIRRPPKIPLFDELDGEYGLGMRIEKNTSLSYLPILWEPMQKPSENLWKK